MTSDMTAEPNLFPDRKKLVLLDGMALVYRAHFALIRSPRYTSGGLCTSAVFGMANTVLDIIKKEKPTHIAAAFDTSEPTERHKVFPEYKAQRDALPEDIGLQLPYIDRLLGAFNITVIRMPGYEADDIIGTMAHQAAEQGFRTLMVTPDKDYHQLVSDDSVVFRPGRKGAAYETLGVPEVLEHWNIKRVDQVIDILGLMGDASDNIPGVPGIGPKTAQKLIAEYGSIEELLQHTHQLKGKQRERVEQNAEMAVLSKQLVTIQLDVPHKVVLDTLQLEPQNDEVMQTLFEELEFDGLGKKMFGNRFSSSASRAAKIREKREVQIQTTLFDDVDDAEVKTIRDVQHAYHTVCTPEERSELIDKLLQQKSICFDMETTGLDPRTALPLGIAFSFEPHTGYYVVCAEHEVADSTHADISSPENDQAVETNSPAAESGTARHARNEVLEEFRGVLGNPAIRKIGHNLKYDVTLLKWNGIDVHGELMDTMLAHSMKEPEMRHGLDYLSELYLAYKPIPTSDLIGERGKEQKNMREVPVEIVSEYAAEDADVTLQVAAAIEPDIAERGFSQVCYEVECPLIPVLVDMEYEGIRLDTDALARYSVQLSADLDQLRDTIYQAAGHEFNIDSPKQLGIVLYEELELEKNPKKTATGQWSTREAELQRLSGKHQIVADVLDYRSAAKLKSVYVDQLPSHLNPQTGRLHTHYSQTWTATGRMQSNDPNLQTIPVRKQRGREIRAAFVPRNEDYLLLSADYSQIELRIMAELSGDEAMLQAFAQGTDIHSVTASKVYGVDLDNVTREMRDKAKMVNFGIIYGISGFGLQQRLNIPRGEANDLINNYKTEYPGVQRWIDETIEFANQHGYVRTQTGRRRYLRDITSRNKSLANAAERLAMNSPIQGTAADMLKLAMIKVYAALKAGGFHTKMLLTVHDEIVFDMLKSEEDTVMPVIENAMKTALPMNVPIVVELGTGTNWLEAH
ncbi:MAG: DNA polymerase I [Fuerstiella sp.]|jgi:DNA polymerase-1|nr:DNA polymerase I [Fuerstiella sp.]